MTNPMMRRAAWMMASKGNSFFTDGAQGVWYDPSDFSTLFQDYLGTVPVTAAGQPIGLVLDKSGNNNHLAQAISVDRLTLTVDGNGKYWITGNGVNQNLATAGVLTLPANTNYVSYAIGINKPAGYGAIFNYGTAANSVQLHANWWTGAEYGVIEEVSIGASVLTTANPVKNVLVNRIDRTNPAADARNYVRLDGAVATVTTRLPGEVGSLGNNQLSLFSYSGTAYFGGSFSGMIMRFATTSDSQLASMETWVNSKTGAY